MNEICRGYLRQDGRKGIRDTLLIMHTVNCSSFVAQKITEAIKEKGIDAQLVGTHICFDNQVMIDRLLAFAAHPNIGALLVVGFGCEYFQADKIAEFARKCGKKSEWMLVQDYHGTQGSIAKGIELGMKLAEEIKDAQTVPFYAEDLIIGLECGGSDFTSGLTANYLVGKVSDHVVSCGGTAVFEEPGEMLGLDDYLIGRAANEEAREQIKHLFEKIDRYGRESNMFHISPGNFNGGLSSIEEKSIGSVTKSGTSLIQGTTKIARRPRRKGLWIMDRLQDYNMAIGSTVPADCGGLMDLITLGCQVCFLTTGRGHVAGTPIAPTIKITGNSVTYEKFFGDIDFDASPLLDNKNISDDMEKKLFELLKRVCAGEKTKAQLLGHSEYEMLPSFQFRGCGK